MAACKLVCLVIFFAFVTQGYGCGRESLTLTQSKTGKMVQNKPEWEVKLTNPCFCVFVDTKLTCGGFKSVTPIESFILAKPDPADDACLLRNGMPIGPEGTFAFKYVWDTRYDFKIRDTTMACS